MLIECPNCRHSIRVVDLRPGRFTPRCPRCERSFQLTVPETPGSKPLVSELDASVFAEPVASVALVFAQPEVPALDWPVMAPVSGLSGLRPRRLPGGIPRLLGGHLVLRLLGHGPRGRAVLARPLSLDPQVVLKLLAADRAADPIFLANFTREAFAAAQIEHPNLVAVRELGSDRGHHFCVLDRVVGLSGAELLDARGKLEPHLAAVVILQAARGLKAAQEQGLCHRDVKPANLRLDAVGNVLVDDLGLEMTPSLAAALEARPKSASDPRKRAAGGSDRSVRAAAGTPAFMAPEQAADPVTSDARADVYGLGATFYNLVTGKLPFPGDDAAELIRKHQEEFPVPPAEFVPNLPRQISDIIRTMMGKRPEERYPSMAVVVDVLEGFLDVHGQSAAAILEEAGSTIRQAADALAGSSARRLRFRILALSTAIWLGFVWLLFALGLGRPAMGLLGFGAVSALAALIASGIVHDSELLRMACAALLGGPRAWLIGMTGVLGALAALWIWGGFLPSFLILCGGCLVGTFLVFLDRPLAAQRKLIIDPVKELLRGLRARGHDEVTLRELVARHGGDHWQFLFEPVLGHRALDAARLLQGKKGLRWHRSWVGSWRDALFSVLEQRLQRRRDHQHLRLLERVEEKRLEAAGLNLLTARRKARRIAKAMVVTAGQWREEHQLLDPNERALATQGPRLMERLSVAASQPEPVLEPLETQPNALLRQIDAWTGILLGRGIRFLLCAALLVVLALWLDARGILTGSQVRDQAAELYRVSRAAIEAADPGLFRQLQWSVPWDWRRLAEPLDHPPWIDDVFGKTLRGSNLVAAAAILLFSLLSRSRFTGFLALVGSSLALLGPRWGVAVPALAEHIDRTTQPQFLGILLLILGWLWPRRKTS